jgi:acyl carrier protein
MNVQDRVKRFIVENFYVTDPAGLLPDTSLIATGLVDSTGMLELIHWLEEEFEVGIQDQEMTPENLETLARIDAYLARKLAGPAVRA